MNAPNYRSKYFNFPLCFLQGIHESSQHIGDICRWCIINYAQTINYKLEDVARQTMYLYYRQEDALLYKVRRHLEDMVNDEKLDIDEDYQGFSGPEFFPETEIEQLLQEYNSDSDFKKSCVQQYQYGQAKKLLNISGGDIQTVIASYQKLNEFLAQFENGHGKDGYTSIQTGVLLDARDGKIPVDMFALLAAVKSIIGRRNFNKTSRGVIVSRMIGAKSTAVLAELLADPILQAQYSKYDNRYRFNKLMERTIMRGFLLKIPAGRGFFISTRYADLDDFYAAMRQRQERYILRITQAKKIGRIINSQKTK